MKLVKFKNHPSIEDGTIMKMSNADSESYKKRGYVDIIRKLRGDKK